MAAHSQATRRPLNREVHRALLLHRSLPPFPPLLLAEQSVPELALEPPPREQSSALCPSLHLDFQQSKIHDSRPLSVKSLKSLGDNVIVDQHFTTRDFAEAELVFMEVFRFDIGASQVAYRFLEDLLIQFRVVSRIGELVSGDLCTQIMDLLYETEETSKLLLSPYALAASVLVTAYLLSVPKQQWEFPVLPWVKFVTSYEEEAIGEMVANILNHILSPKTAIQ